MLAADKLLLQSSLKQNAIQLKEKELNLHNTNFGSLGTQAAVLAGFAVTALIEFSPPPDIHETRYLEIAYYVCCMLSLVTNLYCVAGSTVLSVFATNLALRGPDGSVERAVEGMHEERRGVFISFAIGLASLLMGMIFGAWIMMSTEAAAISSVIVGVGGWCVYSFCKRTYRRFSFEEHGDIDDFVYAVVSRLPRLPRISRTTPHGSPTEEKKEV
uniref:H(+)-exporting diphosphatase n=2 Tax=Lotharella globosa TaxID=91324 RepID=A0A7S4DTP6_9EUKA|mmetsp:Transcript_22430/g.45017  ORF Transcript_22430/g.45017 Transcript_22430/m.45017 type:complete len:215 (+) Transcript_22430:117-761(+)